MVQYFAQDPASLGLSVSGIVWRDNRILLMQRADNGHWGLPGGFVEVGESVTAAVEREVAEETGYAIRVLGLVGVYSDPADNVVDYGPGTARGCIQIVNLCFSADAGEAGKPTTPEETQAVDFFAPDDLPEPFVPIHRVRIEDARSGGAAAIR